MIKEAVVIILLLAVGLMVGLHLQGVDVVPSITNSIGGIFTKIGDTWKSLPEPVKSILQVISIPSLISGVFFAYTKIRAMNKLNEVQVLATKETGQLTGQLTEARQVISQREQEINALSNTADGSQLRQILLDKQQLQNELTASQQRVRQLEDNIHDLQKLVTDQKLDIKMLKQRIAELTIVA